MHNSDFFETTLSHNSRTLKTHVWNACKFILFHFHEEVAPKELRERFISKAGGNSKLEGNEEYVLAHPGKFIRVVVSAANELCV